MLKLNNLKTIFCLVASSIACVAYSETQNSLNSGETAMPKYECPTPGTWVDCMPIINGNYNFYCRTDVRNWVVENCPDVEYVD